MFAALIAGFFVSMLSMPILMRIALPLQLTDMPGGRKMHSEPIPCVGGIGIAIGTFLPVLLWLPMTSTLVPFLIGCLVLVLTGVLDDRFDLDYRAKLAAQIAAAALAVWGGVVIERLPFFAGPVPGYIGYPLTILFLVAVTNAVNFLDGLDGLAAGHSVMTLSAIGILAYLTGDSIVSFVAIALIGSLFGFLRYNTYPARVFMGDAGSQLLGFGGAALALLLTKDRPGDFNSVFPFALIGLPLLDVVSVVFMRMRRGLSPFAADRNHIHHRLLALGLTHRQAVSLIYLVQAAFVFGAVALRGAPGEVLALAYVGFGMLLLAALSLARPEAWQRRSRHETDLERAQARTELVQRIRPILLYAIELATAAFLVLGSVLARGMSRDVAVMAIVLAGSLALALIASRRSREGLFRLTAYLTSLLVAYFLDPAMQQDPIIRGGVYAFLIVLAGLVFAAIRLSDTTNFRVTPQDLLILCLVVFFMALPPHVTLPGQSEGFQIGSLFFRAAVLFYAAEVLFSQTDRDWRVLNIAALASLATLGFRGWPLI